MESNCEYVQRTIAVSRKWVIIFVVEKSLPGSECQEGLRKMGIRRVQYEKQLENLKDYKLEIWRIENRFGRIQCEGVDQFGSGLQRKVMISCVQSLTPGFVICHGVIRLTRIEYGSQNTTIFVTYRVLVYIQMSQPTTCFGFFQLGHLQVGYFSHRKYTIMQYNY